MKWLLLMLLLFSLFFIVGCGDDDKIEVSKLNRMLEEKRIQSALLCKDRGMGYVGLEMLTYEKLEAVCMLNSPPKIYRFEVT